MSVQVIGCLSATVLYLCFFFTASKLQFRHRVEGLRTHRFWLARARLVVAFGLFGSVASSFGTMWKGCERTVFGCLFSGLCFACLGHEACCRSRLSEASHRGILLGVGSNPAAVRAFRMGSFTAPSQSFLQDLKQSYQFKNKAPTLLEDHWGISNLSLVALFLVWQPCFQSAQNSLLTQFFGCQLVFLSSTFFEENTSSSPKFCLLKWSARHVKMVC